MKRPLLALTLLALASCGDGGTGNATPAAPVAAAPAPAGQNWLETSAKTAEGYVLGNPNAPIKLVEYGSRLCGACKAFADTAYKPLSEQYVATGKVSFEFRDFLIHGAADVAGALLGQCGGAEPFFPLTEQMYANQTQFAQAGQAMTPAMQAQLQAASPTAQIGMLAEQMGMIDFVKQRGIPEAQARACLADTAAIDRLTKITQDRGADGTVEGTPTLIVNGTKVDGIGWADVEKALKAAGA